MVVNLFHVDSRSVEEVKDILASGIPLSQFMQVEMIHCDGRSIQLQAPWEPNKNHKGAAFGGSLAAFAILTGWALIEVHLRTHSFPGELVIARSRMRFLRPITHELNSFCAFPPDYDLESHLKRMFARGRDSLDLSVTLGDVNQPALTFEGTYMAIKHEQPISKYKN